MTSIIYLHGLLSSSKSNKAQYFKKIFAKNFKYYIPDLYPQKWEFEQSTVSYLLNKVNEWINFDPREKILIGSSFGGLLATRYLQLNNSEGVKKMILIAPALNYYDVLTKHSYSKEEIHNWEKIGFKNVIHPAWTNDTKWPWEFVKDLEINHHPMNEEIKIPTLIIHGKKDQVIPISFIEEFVKQQNNYYIETFYLEKGDHYLYKELGIISKKIENFISKRV